MPQIKSAKKRVEVAERNRLRNQAYRSQVRTAIKKVRALVEAQEGPEAIDLAFREAQSLIDRAVLKGVFHKNKGSRDKARLMAFAQRTAS